MPTETRINTLTHTNTVNTCFKNVSPQVKFVHLPGENRTRLQCVCRCKCVLLGQTAGHRHLRAPLDLPVLTLLMAGDRPRRFLCDDFVPVREEQLISVVF